MDKKKYCENLSLMLTDIFQGQSGTLDVCKKNEMIKPNRWKQYKHPNQNIISYSQQLGSVLQVKHAEELPSASSRSTVQNEHPEDYANVHDLQSLCKLM